ncbi:type IV secretory system conjugative DNA transfer family protein [Roseofilum capinflatum]|uniref:Type IV secretory system conjugative DNA transfer family protein n=1 Tax=Roseofilum capinflatum BLCC-M114 TaxID=3022440 RepID=A0ABT7B704_9CYAN|nr:type IV secretory system conjugative DNA transfer family protein [Roseofilum capinflatum]MDJ1174890.1 type IV secretory system conjugative DNA transfer family protein [Roseofilum capinflatum BLCC-M114]
MTKSALIKSLYAGTNLGLGIVAALSISAGLSNRNLIVGSAALTQGILINMGVIHRHRKHDLTLDDYVGSMTSLSTDIGEALWAVVDSVQVKKAGKSVVEVSPTFARRFLEAGKEKARERFWALFDAFNQGSCIFAGSRGSGKSTAMRYAVATRMLEDPNAELIVIDPHYDPDETVWLPGVSPSEHSAFVVRDPERALEVMRETLAEGERRERENLKKEPRTILVVDEFQMLVDATDALDEIAHIIKQIMNRFRKYRVDVILGLHSLKKLNTGLDSSAVNQMSILALGNLINDTATIVPSNWNRNELDAHRQRLGKYSGILAPLDKSPEAVALPDFPKLFKELPSFRLPDSDPDVWLQRNESDLNDAYAKGARSVRALSEALGIQRLNDDPRYRALKIFIDSKLRSSVDAA